MSKILEKDGSFRPLSVKVADNALVISIGLEMLKFVAEHCPAFQGEDCSDGPWERIVDAKELASDVRRALQDEEEDGTTPVHRLLDTAIVAARDDGSLAFACDD